MKTEKKIHCAVCAVDLQYDNRSGNTFAVSVLWCLYLKL